MSKRREPIDLLVAKGRKNLTKKEIKERKEREIKVGSENVNPPPYLPEELKTEFHRIADILKDIGIISDLDVDALARYLISEYQYEKVTLRMLKMKNITEKYFDFANLQDKFFKQARAAASDLGLTISSRCKLVLPKPKETQKETEGSKRFGDRI